MKTTTSKSPEPDAEIVRLVDHIGSLLPRHRMAAREALRARGEAAVHSLLLLFHQEKEQRAQRWHSYERVALCLVIANLVIAFYALSANGQVIFFLFLLPLLLIGSFGLGSLVQAPTRRLKVTAACLAMFDDLRVVGPLAEALEIKDDGLVRYDIYSSAAGGLKRLLPRLRSKDARRLDDTQRACLHHALNPNDPELIKDPELVIVILDALAYVGDSNALPHVRRLAQGAAWTRNGERIRTAARKCLTSLLERVEQERAPQTLLRASSLPTTSADILLRPADGSPSVAPDQLLRVASTDDSPTG